MPGAGDLFNELAFKFMGGTNGPVNFCWVMKGCNLACCGDHRSSGLMFKRPRTKSMNATRLFISAGMINSWTQGIKGRGIHTSVDLALLHVLTWHGIRLDNIRQRVGYGPGEIRTLDAIRHDAFQVHYNQPLCHKPF